MISPHSIRRRLQRAHYLTPAKSLDTKLNPTAARARERNHRPDRCPRSPAMKAHRHSYQRHSVQIRQDMPPWELRPCRPPNKPCRHFRPRAAPQFRYRTRPTRLPKPSGRMGDPYKAPADSCNWLSRSVNSRNLSSSQLMSTWSSSPGTNVSLTTWEPCPAKRKGVVVIEEMAFQTRLEHVRDAGSCTAFNVL